MNLAPHAASTAQICEQARRSRDPRFDGLFFTAVLSTRIYCRPVCPAPWAKRVVYFASAAAAEAAGFRPCLRCRPELSPEDGTWRRGDDAVARALKLIHEGLLADESLPALAARVGLSERQLRRLFIERLGAAPAGVHGTRRLLFAKQLLTETTLPITEVGLAAGFRSLRRFNAAFRGAYRMAPRDLRRRPGAAQGEALTLRLGYRPPYDFGAQLDFLRRRALPGVEIVDDASYARVFASDPAEPEQPPRWLRISARPGGEHALKLELHGAPPSQLLNIVNRLRRMFDLDAEPRTIAQALSADARLRPLLEKRPGLRIPGGWDGFEIAVRAIVAQEAGVVAGRTLTARIVRHFGIPAPRSFPTGLERLFPSPESLAEADLGATGLSRTRADAVRAVARALLDGVVDFNADRTLEDFVARWMDLPGIGPWIAHYIALRALGHPDAFPTEDRVLRHVFAPGAVPLTGKALNAIARAWRPWRAYAVIQTWCDTTAPP